MLPDKTWPETGLSSTNPSTWGQLYFGTPTYTPQPASPAGTVTIRRGLNGDVPDTAVGGGNSCGYPLPTDPATLFTQWGQANYGSEMTFNIRNQVKTADWPCFTKYYVTFPLTAVPAGKVVVSATLTLHQMGHVGEGWDPGPATSYIQVLTVGQDWSESTLNWNNAPMARENVAITVVPPLTEGELEHNDPGPARIWDVSRAAAEAYGAGEPLRLAVYSADEAMQSGKYFWASEHPANFAPEARPSLTVVWGEPAAVVQKTARPVAPVSGQPFTYTLQFLGVREALTLTDNLPAQVSSPGAIVVQGGGVAAYDSDLHQVTWTGMPSVGQTVTVTFPVTVSARGPLVVSNTAVLAGATGTSSTGTAVSIVDARRIWLPMIRR
jgi:hypothetical protein